MLRHQARTYENSEKHRQAQDFGIELRVVVNEC